jgi:hypothetical protein
MGKVLPSERLSKEIEATISTLGREEGGLRMPLLTTSDEVPGLIKAITECFV